MKSAILVFPGSNCDRDAEVALRTIAGVNAQMIWHNETDIPGGTDLVILPGGFSYGDYLRTGAIAANSPIIAALRAHAARGGYILGICNGFQILCETGLLPGALIRNSTLRFICKSQALQVASSTSVFTAAYVCKQDITLPIAHHDGHYMADSLILDQLADEDRIAFRYMGNPNGSARDIAGILSANRRILGMMPHPERAIGNHEGGSDGRGLFTGLADQL